MAKGYRQIFGIDFGDTYASVVRLSALHILFSVAIDRHMHIHGMDIKNAFLNKKIDLEMFIEQPEGFEDKDVLKYVCRLLKAV